MANQVILLAILLVGVILGCSFAFSSYTPPVMEDDGFIILNPGDDLPDEQIPVIPPVDEPIQPEPEDNENNTTPEPDSTIGINSPQEPLPIRSLAQAVIAGSISPSTDYRVNVTAQLDKNANTINAPIVSQSAKSRYVNLTLNEDSTQVNGNINIDFEKENFAPTVLDVIAHVKAHVPDVFVVIADNIASFFSGLFILSGTD